MASKSAWVKPARTPNGAGWLTSRTTATSTNWTPATCWRHRGRGWALRALEGVRGGVAQRQFAGRLACSPASVSARSAVRSRRFRMRASSSSAGALKGRRRFGRSSTRTAATTSTTSTIQAIIIGGPPSTRVVSLGCPTRRRPKRHDVGHFGVPGFRADPPSRREVFTTRGRRPAGSPTRRSVRGPGPPPAASTPGRRTRLPGVAHPAGRQLRDPGLIGARNPPAAVPSVLAVTAHEGTFAAAVTHDGSLDPEAVDSTRRIAPRDQRRFRQLVRGPPRHPGNPPTPRLRRRRPSAHGGATHWDGCLGPGDPLDAPPRGI